MKGISKHGNGSAAPREYQLYRKQDERNGDGNATCEETVMNPHSLTLGVIEVVNKAGGKCSVDSA
jgi:hypothetical protein